MTTAVQRIIRRGQLQAVTGYSVPHIYELISEGKFPRPVPLGRRAVGWLESEIAEWQAGRIAERDAGRAA
jgi:prophage regulatory protein